MSLLKVLGIQVINLLILVPLSLMALEAWWKICLFGIAIMTMTTALAFRYKTSAVALTVGSLPIAWIVGLLAIVVGRSIGLNQ